MPRTPRHRLAKLTRPRLRDALPRPRLFDALDAASASSVTWIHGPPGFGKTTLVSTYLESRGCPHLWYTMDAGDADPATWFFYLREAASAGQRGKRPLPLYTPEYDADPAAFARRFFRAFHSRLPAGSVMVFDNYHAVPSASPMHALFDVACTELPDALRMIVISREGPPARLAHLHAAERIARLDDADLRLTREESRHIASAKTRLDDGSMDRLHLASEGWPAGLTLMLEHVRRQARPTVSTETRQAVFAYFAGIVFEGLSASDQRALMHLALLPQFTSGMAQAITRRQRISDVLEHLRERQLFLYGLGTRATVFQFHALFREFLLHRLDRELSPGARVRASLAAAVLLDREGYLDEALRAFRDGEDWVSAVRLTCSAAPALLAQGRWRALLDLVAQIPQDRTAASGWLLHWRGRARMNEDLAAARNDLEASSRVFHEVGDAVGHALSLAMTIQVAVAEHRVQAEWRTPVETMGRLLHRVTTWPNAEQELIARGAYLFSAAHVRPDLPDIEAALPRLLALMDDDTLDPNVLAGSGVQLLIHLTNTADVAGSRRLVTRLDALSKIAEMTVLNRTMILVYGALAEYGTFQRFDDALRRFEEARQMARAHGLADVEAQILQFEAEIHTYTDRDRAASRAALQALREARVDESSIARVFFHCTAAHAATWDGDTDGALSHAKQCLAAAAESSEAFYLLFGRWLVQTYVDAADVDGAQRLLDDLEHRLSGTCYESTSRGLLGMQRAYVALRTGRRPECHARLRDALVLARMDERQFAQICWIGRALPALLGEALEANIEPEFVRALITQLDLPPVGTPPAHWPWPVCIQTLGGFELKLRGMPVRFGRKVPRKTLMLLKALIAFGATEVREDRIIDALWPDADGDAAYGAYTMAVVRLRRLLGDARALVQRGRTLSLARDRCLVDAWQFEQPTTVGSAPAAVHAAATPGDFLPDDLDLPWTSPMRERLRRHTRVPAIQADRPR